MSSNQVLILNQVLEERRKAIAPDLPEADFFEAFASAECLKDYDLSWDDIVEGRLGSGGDGGLDAGYLFVNSHLIREDTDLTHFRGDISIELVLIQAKRSKGFSEAAINTIAASLQDLLDLTSDFAQLTQTFHADVLGFFEQFRRVYLELGAKLPQLNIRIAYVTKGSTVHDNTRRRVSGIRQAVANHFRDSDVSLEFVGAPELVDLIRKRPKTTFKLPFREDLSGSGGNVALIGLKQFTDFISTESGSLNKALFDANVRDHQGDVSVNQAIRRSLEKGGPEDFWWLNNGVTILAAKVTATGKTYTIEDPQVVNGLQTSFELFHYFSHNESTDTDNDVRSVLVRIITPQQGDSHEKIIRATNSQTSIPFASLKATDPIHRNIEDFFYPNGLYYERRKNFYKNAGRPLASIITIAFLAQATMSQLLSRPNDARARPTTVLKRKDDYDRIFNDKHPLQMYEKIARIQRLVGSFLKSHPSNMPAKTVNNLRFHMSYFVIRKIIWPIPITASTIAEADLSQVTPELLDASLKVVFEDYSAEGGDDKAAKSTLLAARLAKHFPAPFQS